MLTGIGVALNPPHYAGLWTITQERGKWDIRVQYPHYSNIVTFKINKREQVVQYALPWAGLNWDRPAQNPPFSDCHTFVAYVYNRLGLPIGSDEQNR